MLAHDSIGSAGPPAHGRDRPVRERIPEHQKTENDTCKIRSYNFPFLCLILCRVGLVLASRALSSTPSTLERARKQGPGPPNSRDRCADGRANRGGNKYRFHITSNRWDHSPSFIAHVPYPCTICFGIVFKIHARIPTSMRSSRFHSRSRRSPTRHRAAPRSRRSPATPRPPGPH